MAIPKMKFLGKTTPRKAAKPAAKKVRRTKKKGRR